MIDPDMALAIQQWINDILVWIGFGGENVSSGWIIVGVISADCAMYSASSLGFADASAISRSSMELGAASQAIRGRRRIINQSRLN